MHNSDIDNYKCNKSCTTATFEKHQVTKNCITTTFGITTWTRAIPQQHCVKHYLQVLVAVVRMCINESKITFTNIYKRNQRIYEHLKMYSRILLLFVFCGHGLRWCCNGNDARMDSGNVAAANMLCILVTTILHWHLQTYTKIYKHVRRPSRIYDYTIIDTNIYKHI